MEVLVEWEGHPCKKSSWVSWDVLSIAFPSYDLEARPFWIRGGEVMSPTSEELGQEVGMAPNEGTKLVDPKPKRVRRRPIWAEDYEM